MTSEWGVGEKEKLTAQATTTKIQDSLKRDDTPDKKIGKVVLLYGDTGVGKTYCAMSSPEPIFFIDTEMRGYSVKRNFPDKDIRVFIPLRAKETFDLTDEDPLSTHESINNISKYIIEICNMAKKGEITSETEFLGLKLDELDFLD